MPRTLPRSNKKTAVHLAVDMVAFKANEPLEDILKDMDSNSMYQVVNLTKFVEYK